MESKYSINVARHVNTYLPKGGLWSHFFRVEINDRDEAAVVARELATRFPECKVETTYWNCIGTEVVFPLPEATKN